MSISGFSSEVHLQRALDLLLQFYKIKYIKNFDEDNKFKKREIFNRILHHITHHMQVLLHICGVSLDVIMLPEK